jgi:NADPH:quinone reductase-like Zn-dependent oxidoreductase
MHAAVVNTWGEAPKYQEFSLPEPSADQLRVKVLAGAAHTIVRSRAAGRHYTTASTSPPHIPGIDGVGIVESPHSSLHGKKVYINALRTATGTFAEYINVSPQEVFELPDEADPVAVAASVNPGLSGWMGLTARAGLNASERKPFEVLVLGATGASGKAAVQIAKGMGATRVVAAGRNEAVLEELKGLGADATISLGYEDSPGEGKVDFGAAAEVDVVLDYLWSEWAQVAMKSMVTQRKDKNKRLTWVGIGTVAGPLSSVDGSILRSSNTVVCGCGPGSWSFKELDQQMPSLLKTLVQQGVKTECEVRKLADVEKSWPETGAKRLVFEP